MRRSSRRHFQTRREVERYFGGKTITCLICGGRYGRLSFHLAAKHGMTTDEYKAHFGLPWSRGLISALSLANSGWDSKRRAKASRLARKTKFFKFAHMNGQRRKLAPFLRDEALKHLGTHAVGFGKKFESRVLTLFRRGLTDAAIAEMLDVNTMTVNRRTKHWRKSSPRSKSRKPRRR
jgi:hypothetical protein